MLGQLTNGNKLLSAMSPDAYALLMNGSDVVDLNKGRDLAVAGQRLDYCWFPLDGMVSLIAADVDGNEAEVGVVGSEGLVNSNIALGADRSAQRMLVQLSGTAVRVEAATMIATFRNSDSLQQLVLSYVHALQVQLSFSALAYARYSIPQRLARWLLMCADRAGGCRIKLTHEAISIMLGIRRASVTTALQGMAATGAIEVHRAGLTIIDRQLLLHVARSGYGAPEAAYRRLLPQVVNGSPPSEPA